MGETITDPDVQALAAIAASLEGEYTQERDIWVGSPFAWIVTTKSPRRRGKIGEQLVAGFLAARDFDVVRCPDSEADRIINGHRAEIKFSTLWESGIFTFQQIRDQNYEFAICLGLCPFDARCWVVPKKELFEHVIGHTGQHGGAGSTETAWISFPPELTDRYAWLRPYGGRLRDAVCFLRERYPRAQDRRTR